MLAACWPNVLESRIPETESDSSVMALISAIDCCVSRLTTRRTFPTRKVMYAKIGSIPRLRAVSLQSRISIATTVLATVAKLERSELAVSVTTDCTPPTSLLIRLWISPVRVSVKKRSGIHCRWL